MESYLRRMPGWLLTGIGVVLAFWLGFFGVVAWWHWQYQPNASERGVAAKSAAEPQAASVPQPPPRRQAPEQEAGAVVDTAPTEPSPTVTNPGDRLLLPAARPELELPTPKPADATDEPTLSVVSGREAGKTEVGKTFVRREPESVAPVDEVGSIASARHQWHAWQQANRWVLIVRRGISKASLEKERSRLQPMVPSGLELLLVPTARGNRHEWLLVLGPFATQEAARSTVFALPVAFLSQQMDLVRAKAIRWQ